MANQKKAARKRVETVASPAGESRKQARVAKNEQLHREKVRFGGLGANERRFLEKEGFNLDLEFCMDVSDSERQQTARALREAIIGIKKRKKQSDAMKRFLASQITEPLVDEIVEWLRPVTKGSRKEQLLSGLRMDESL